VLKYENEDEDENEDEPLRSRALQYSLNNLNRELAGQSTDDPECINGEWLSLPLLYCLHIERHENQPEAFNIHLPSEMALW
jgi:hypothetical protein